MYTNIKIIKNLQENLIFLFWILFHLLPVQYYLQSGFTDSDVSDVIDSDVTDACSMSTMFYSLETVESFFLCFVLKFYHSVTWYGSLFIHPAWHLMGLLNLKSFFGSGKFSSIIVLFLFPLFPLALRVGECCNFWVYILCLLSFPPCPPALHPERHIHFIKEC